MRIAYVDCFSGISGDMFLGALVDAGVPADLLRETVRKLNVGADLEISRVERNGIAATKVDVIVGGVKDMPREEWLEQRGDAGGQGAHEHEHAHVHSHAHTHADGTTHAHEHAHAHSHPHGHEDEAHSHGHEHGTVADREHAYHDAPEVHAHKRWGDEHEHAHGHSHEYRGLKEIREIIGRAAIPAGAKERALEIFGALGEAEAKIHNKDVEAIHFHEVGSVDAIVDIVCAAVGAESLGVDEWVCSALNVGGGVVECAHGTLPVPAPATLELLKDAPVYSSGVQKELVTPTGAAIVKTLVGRFGEMPMMKVSATGYGAGARNLKGQANVVRVTVGEGVAAQLRTTERQTQAASPRTRTGERVLAQSGNRDEVEFVTVLEASIDDMSPQVFGYVIEKLMAEGALDAFGTPVQMKKGRPGMVLTVLAREEDMERIAETIFAETTTIGLRMRREQRRTLQREWVKVETPWGEVRVKVAEMNGKVTNFAPEFEDCKKLAMEHGVPLKTVMQEAVKGFLEKRELGAKGQGF